MRESIRSGQPRRYFFAQNFKAIYKKQPLFGWISKNNIETFKEIVEKTKSREEENSRLFEYKAYSGTGILLIQHCFKFYLKCSTLLKHPDSLAFAVVCNYRETTWFWQLESTPPGHYNVRKCADVWPLCWISVQNKVSIQNDYIYKY